MSATCRAVRRLTGTRPSKRVEFQFIFDKPSTSSAMLRSMRREPLRAVVLTQGRGGRLDTAGRPAGRLGVADEKRLRAAAPQRPVSTHAGPDR